MLPSHKHQMHPVVFCNSFITRFIDNHVICIHTNIDDWYYKFLRRNKVWANVFLDTGIYIHPCEPICSLSFLGLNWHPTFLMQYGTFPVIIVIIKYYEFFLVPTPVQKCTALQLQLIRPLHYMAITFCCSWLIP